MGTYDLDTTGSQVNDAINAIVDSGVTEADLIKLHTEKQNAAASLDGFVSASDKFSSAGDVQFSRFILRGTTTDGSLTELVSPERFVISNEKAYFCSIIILARQDTGVSHNIWRRNLVIERTAGTVALLDVIKGSIDDYEALADLDFYLSADDTNKSLKVEVIGKAATNLRWLTLIEAAELAYND